MKDFLLDVEFTIESRYQMKLDLMKKFVQEESLL